VKRKAASQSSFEDSAARKRIETLLSLAKSAYFEGEQKLSTRYVILARKIAMRHRLKIGVAAFCKHCNQVFCEQGKTHKVRVIAGKAYRVCGACGKKRMAGKVL
jgi:RNase P subunit RPR2